MTDFHDALERTLGSPIEDICPNKFHSHSANHCAHYVSHMAGFDFSFNCREFKGGSAESANVRVHEIFSRSPSVGTWDDRPTGEEPLLVFVTRVSNVNVDEKKMGNIPQKHIGVFSGGNIFHYSNSQEKVVKWDAQKFLDTFESIYSGTQGLYYGTFPGSDLDLTVKTDPQEVIRGRAFELKKKGEYCWFAKTGDEVEFYVGHETSSNNYVGLYMKSSEYYGPRYDAADYVDNLDHWVQLLELTGYCESRNYFNVINTYDSAKFTFGFLQMAAHTPNDNLILFFHRLFTLSEMADYFPELTIINGNLHRIDENGGATDLEEVMSTGPNNRKQLQLFMNYLNAKLKSHDKQEVLQSTRLIHWSNNSAALRSLQVNLANEILQKKMSSTYAKWYDLDGQKDFICALVADIHHQGRASRKRVRAALDSDDPVERLITINQNYKGRIAALREKLAAMQQSGQLGEKRYSADQNEFV